MRMKIVQLEAQSERSLSAKEVLERHANVTLLQTASVRDFQRAADSQDVDLFLCSQSDLTSDEGDLLAILSAKYPHVPVVIVSTADERAELLRDPNLRAWDVLSASELDRLPLCITRAVESKRLRDGLQFELTQARDLLISCQKSISVGRLLGSIAHEINNPLEAITNLLYLGQRNASDEEEVRRCLQMAEAELQRVGEITKQMLYFHRDSTSPQEVALSEVIESVFVLYQNRLDMRQIKVLKQYRSNAMLIAHPGELRQAFSNVIANAIDAMPQGGQLLVRSGGRAVQTVRDHRGSWPRNLARRDSPTG
jgi:signal transduction histidine kinase